MGNRIMNAFINKKSKRKFKNRSFKKLKKQMYSDSNTFFQTENFKNE